MRGTFGRGAASRSQLLSVGSVVGGDPIEGVFVVRGQGSGFPVEWGGEPLDRPIVLRGVDPPIVR